MDIDELSIIDLLIDNIPGAPPPQDSPNAEPIDPQHPDPTCNPAPRKTKAYRPVVGVENAGGRGYGKASGLYNKHYKYSEHWNPWHTFRSAHDFQQAQSFSHQTKPCIDPRLRCGLDNFRNESRQSANALQKLLSELDFGHSDDSWIWADSHSSGILYYRDIFKCVQFLLAHLPYQARLHFNWCASLTLMVVESTARWTWGICGWIDRINFRPEQQ